MIAITELTPEAEKVRKRRESEKSRILKVESYNYPYIPIFINEEKFGKSRDELYVFLKENNIHGRRYFFPLISQFPIYRDLISARADNLPVAEEITKKVLCLPIYPDLEKSDLFKYML